MIKSFASKALNKTRNAFNGAIDLLPAPNERDVQLYIEDPSEYQNYCGAQFNSVTADLGVAATVAKILGFKDLAKSFGIANVVIGACQVLHYHKVRRVAQSRMQD